MKNMRITLFTLLFVFLATSFLSAQDYCMSGPVGYGAGTTGGEGGSVVQVNNRDDLEKELLSEGKKIIVVTQSIYFREGERVSGKIKDKTLVGLNGVKLVATENVANGGCIHFPPNSGSENVIIRNLHFEGTGSNDLDGNDLLENMGCIGLWVDHCDFFDGVDGNFDNTMNADNVTISWCRFGYNKKYVTDHRFSNLIGGDADVFPADGRFSITFQYCWWDNGCRERMPRARNADLHMLNCYFASSNTSYAMGLEKAQNGLYCYAENCDFGTLSSGKIYKAYNGGASALWLTGCTTSQSLPSNIGDEADSKPSYSGYTSIAAAEVKNAVTGSCGAGATLSVDPSTGTAICPPENTPSVSSVSYTSGGTGSYVSSTGTLTIQPNDGYRLAKTTPYTTNPSGTYVVMTPTGTANTYTLVPTANCSVTINYELIPSYTVSFHAGGGTCSTNSLSAKDDESITLPSSTPPTVAEGTISFVGWTTEANWSGELLPSPLFKSGNKYYPKSNTDLYAIYQLVKDNVPSNGRMWDFTSWNIDATYEDSHLLLYSNGTSFHYRPPIAKLALAFDDGTVVPGTEGLKFTAGGADKIRIYFNKDTKADNYLYVNGNSSDGRVAIYIPCNSGDKIYVDAETFDSSSARGFTVISGGSGDTATSKARKTWEYTATGSELALRSANAMKIYSITINMEELVDREIVYNADPENSLVDPFIWLGTNGNSWADAGNWKSGVVPAAGDFISISEDAVNYPSLSSETTVSEIHFEHGAEIGNIHLLNYDKAYVSLDHSKSTLAQEKWKLMSSPLKEVYTGDLSYGGYPIVYYREFDTSSSPYSSTSEGTWTNTLSSGTIKLKPGQGFSFRMEAAGSIGGTWANASGAGLEQTGGVMTLPYFNKSADSKSHVLHTFEAKTDASNPDYYGDSRFGTYRRASTGVEPTGRYTDPVSRTKEAFQLITTDYTYDVTFSAAGDALVGNPYMMTIDFEQFYEANKDLIQKQFKAWDGDGFVTYSSITDASKYIAPMQSFIVTKLPEAASSGILTFDVDAISGGEIRSGEIVTSRLIVTASNSEGTVKTYIAQNESGSSVVGEADSRKILMGDRNPNLPEIYTLKPSGTSRQVGLDVQVLDVPRAMIPLALASTSDEEITFSFTGMEDYDAQITFVDRVLNHEEDITGKDNFSYSFTQESADGTAVEDRFFIQLAPQETTAWEAPGKETIQVYTKAHAIYVVTPTSDTIQQIEIYNEQGVLIVKENHVNASYYSLLTEGLSRNVIVKVTTESEVVIAKLRIQN